MSSQTPSLSLAFRLPPPSLQTLAPDLGLGTISMCSKLYFWDLPLGPTSGITLRTSQLVCPFPSPFLGRQLPSVGPSFTNSLLCTHTSLIHTPCQLNSTRLAQHLLAPQERQHTLIKYSVPQKSVSLLYWCSLSQGQALLWALAEG